MEKTHCRRKKGKMELIPSDLLMSHILLRLPLISLVCCMCVSKEWDALLKSKTFAKMHLHQITQDDHQNKLVAQSTDAPCMLFDVIECEATDVTVIRPVPFKVTHRHMWFLSSCNGLVVVGLKNWMLDLKFSDLILWNPLTSEYKIFSKTNSPKEVYNVSRKVFKLYYSSSDDDYRILHVTKHHDVYIYSLKSDSWRNVNSTKIPNTTSYDRWRRAASLNGNLYFLKSTRHRGRRTGPYSVISFDTKNEKFTEIPTPNFQNQISSLSVERGCIYLCCRVNHTRTHPYAIELWKMKGEDGGWMMVTTYSPMKGLTSRYLRQLHLLRDGYWLMKSYSGSICKVDLENQHKGKDFEYTLQGFHQGNKYNFHQVKRYIETFVSPNHYVK